MANNIDVNYIKSTMSQMYDLITDLQRKIYIYAHHIHLIENIIETNGVLKPGDFAIKWMDYMRNEVGMVEADGTMQGFLKINKYGC